VRRSAVLAAVALAAVLSACGSDGTSSDASDPKTSDPATALSIVVLADEDAKPMTYELTCDPAGGDHPQPQQACDALSDAGASVLEPVGSDTSCTAVFGGPQTASITGTYAGKGVDASFDRTNGCEIERWEKLGTTFFTVALQ
jgi:hypothetical protein